MEEDIMSKAIVSYKPKGRGLQGRNRKKIVP
jgi:hypothetical protein